jgi:hypothetical protein
MRPLRRAQRGRSYHGSPRRLGGPAAVVAGGSHAAFKALESQMSVRPGDRGRRPRSGRIRSVPTARVQIALRGRSHGSRRAPWSDCGPFAIDVPVRLVFQGYSGHNARRGLGGASGKRSSGPKYPHDGYANGQGSPCEGGHEQIRTRRASKPGKYELDGYGCHLRVGDSV